MQRLIFILINTFIFCSCNNDYTKKLDKKDSTISKDIVGNDADEHGCKASAGYAFSKLKNNCIRVFEDGIRLNSISPKIDSTISAFVVFKNKNAIDSVEIFLPNDNVKPILIFQKNNKDSLWKDLNLTLSKQNNIYYLTNNEGETMYSSK